MGAVIPLVFNINSSVLGSQRELDGRAVAPRTILITMQFWIRTSTTCFSMCPPLPSGVPLPKGCSTARGGC